MEALENAWTVKNGELRVKLEAQTQRAEKFEKALEWQKAEAQMEQLNAVAREREMGRPIAALETLRLTLYTRIAIIPCSTQTGNAHALL